MNAPATQNNTAVATRSNTFSAFMAGDAIKQKINEIVGGKKGDGFVTSIVACVSNNPQLAICDNSTILSAGLQGAALDLSPSPALGHFYMVPFEDRKNSRTVAQFQIGYKGYIQLAIRSGQYRRINVIALKEGELISYNRLTEEIFTKLIDDDEIRDALPTTGYYAMFELSNGFIKTMYWSRSKMENHAVKYSKGYAARKGYTFWEKDFDGMAFKTMLRQLLSKWGVMSIELQKAFEADMGVLNADGNTGGSPPVPPAQPSYSADKFKENLPGWRAAIASGKKTADQIIAMVTSRGTLTEEQMAAIRAPAEAPDLFEQIRSQIEKATSPDTLDLAADLIGEVSDPAQREQLTTLYQKRTDELMNG